MNTPAAHAAGAPTPRIAIAGAATMVAAILLLPLGRLSEIAVLAGIVLAAMLLVRDGLRPLRAPAVVLLLALFAGYALPAWLSVIDAVEPRRSVVSALADLRFLPFALMAVLVLRERTALYGRVLGATGLVVGLWALDAWVQGITGVGLAGALESDRVSGVFGDDNLKLGPVLAVLSPIALDEARRRYGRIAFALVWLLLAVAILLAGARAGWIMYALVTLVMLWRIAVRPAHFVAWLVASLVAGSAVGVAAYRISPEFEARIERTLALGGGTRAAVDHALAGRLPIWETAARMALAHPWNGVGIRGFRHAYPDHAAPGDPWVSADGRQGALHPHHLVLEIAAETGAIGLGLWLAALAIAVRAWWLASRAARDRAFAPGLALVAMTFPLNTHFAFYSSFWGLLFWWLVAMWCAGLSERPKDAG
jgi:O-antigen ligase